MIPCLKQLTLCRIVLGNGRVVEATNECNADGCAECPRVTAGSKTGEDYHLCGSTHAEANAAALVPEGNSDGVAFLYGHTWLCGPCQHALTAKGIRVFVVTGEPA